MRAGNLFRNNRLLSDRMSGGLRAYMAGEKAENEQHQKADRYGSDGQSHSRQNDIPDVRFARLMPYAVSAVLDVLFHNYIVTVSRGAPTNRGSLNGSRGEFFSFAMKTATQMPPKPNNAAASIQCK